MDDLKFEPVAHDQQTFLARASQRQGFQAAYKALEVEYTLANDMLAARSRAGLTQEVVASRMGTTKSAISRLESAGKHSPSLTSLKKYAEVVGCKLEVRLIPKSI